MARVFPDKRSLDDDSTLQEVIRGAESDFGLFTDHGSPVLDTYTADLLEAVRRGVRVRIVILDPALLEQNGYGGMLDVTHQEKDFLLVKIRNSLTVLNAARQKISSDGRTYRGSLDVRLMRKPVIYRMWVRDPASEAKAMAHISVLQYRGRMTPPAFRATKLTSERLVKTLSDEFESIWAGLDATAAGDESKSQESAPKPP